MEFNEDIPELNEQKKESEESSENSKKKTVFIKTPQRSEQAIPCKIELSQRSKFDFLTENILVEEEKAEVEKIPIKRNRSKRKTTRKPMRFNFENFPIFSKIGCEREKNEENNKQVFLEKNAEIISRTPSMLFVRHGTEKKSYFGAKVKNEYASIEDFMNPVLEKRGSTTKSDEKQTKTNNLQDENNMGTFWQIKNPLLKNDFESLSNLAEIEFDRMKIYKMYFIHNNVDHIMAIANSFITKRKIFNPRKIKKFLVKKALKKKKIYPYGQIKELKESGMESGMESGVFQG